MIRTSIPLSYTARPSFCTSVCRQATRTVGASREGVGQLYCPNPAVHLPPPHRRGLNKEANPQDLVEAFYTYPGVEWGESTYPRIMVRHAAYGFPRTPLLGSSVNRDSLFP